MGPSDDKYFFEGGYSPTRFERSGDLSSSQETVVRSDRTGNFLLVFNLLLLDGGVVIPKCPGGKRLFKPCSASFRIAYNNETILVPFLVTHNGVAFSTIDWGIVSLEGSRKHDFKIVLWFQSILAGEIQSYIIALQNASGLSCLYASVQHEVIE